MKDKDWNTCFLSNCALPQSDPIRWIDENRRFLRFTLSDKDRGGCPTDRVARHSAPYWERAELRQSGFLKKGKLYSINTSLRFVEGFNGRRETFFQIHAYNNACKQAYPPIMMKFDNAYSDNAVLTLLALNSHRRHRSYRSNLEIDDILGDLVSFNLELDLSEKASVSVSIEGETVFSEIPFWRDPCGTPHIKFGAYRPGSPAGNKRSIVDFDSINVY